MTDQTLPLSGGWIMIKRKLPTEIKPPLLSIFYALPDRLFPKDWHIQRHPALTFGSLLQMPSQARMTLLWRSRVGGRLLPHERQDVQGLEDFELDQRIRIITDEGDVWVEPYEWQPIPDINVYLDLIDGEHIKLHLQSGANFTGSVAAQIFYMQSRGLSKMDCYRMLLGDIKRPNICWLEIHEHYAEFFLGERPKRRTINQPMKVSVVENTDDKQESQYSIGA